MIKRGEVYWVDFSEVFPKGNHYQRGIRPAIIISNEYNNKYCENVNIIPLTTRVKKLPAHADIIFKGKINNALCEQITTIDKRYLDGWCGNVSKEELKKIESCILCQLGMRK